MSPSVSMIHVGDRPVNIYVMELQTAQRPQGCMLTSRVNSGFELSTRLAKFFSGKPGSAVLNFFSGCPKPGSAVLKIFSGWPGPTEIFSELGDIWVIFQDCTLKCGLLEL